MNINKIIACVVSVTSVGFAGDMRLGSHFDKENVSTGNVGIGNAASIVKPTKRVRSADGDTPVAKFKPGVSRQPLVDLTNVIEGKRDRKPSSMLIDPDYITAFVAPKNEKAEPVVVAERKKIKAKRLAQSKQETIKKENVDLTVSGNFRPDDYISSDEESLDSLEFSDISSDRAYSPFRNAQFENEVVDCTGDLFGLGINLSDENIAPHSPAIVSTYIADAAVLYGSPATKLLSDLNESSEEKSFDNVSEWMGSPGEFYWGGSPLTPIAPVAITPMTPETFGRLLSFCE